MKPTTPVEPTANLPELLNGMSMTGFQGRKLGESLAVWTRMIEDPDCTILLGISGALIPAGMQACISRLVDEGYIDVIVATGANIFHDSCEHLGVRHYLGHHHVDDGDLFSRGVDRIYDVFAIEKEFRSVDRKFADFSARISPWKGSSAAFMKLWGAWITSTYPEKQSMIAACTRQSVPIFIPAICDSSIGIGLLMARREGVDIEIDQIADTDEISRIVEDSVKTGVIYLGGGVPKNFIQQTQVIADMYDSGKEGHAYAIQYTTDAPHWGGLSGCTFEEAISWGKESVNTVRAQCFCDATIALPIITSALVAKGVKRGKKGK